MGPRDANGVVQLIVGNRISPPVEIRLNGAVATRARYIFSVNSDSVVRVLPGGDSLLAIGRGRDTITVTVVGATVGGVFDTTIVHTTDKVPVAVRPEQNLVTTILPTITSLGEKDSVSAESRDVNGSRTRPGKVRWYSANPTIFTVDSLGSAKPDSTNHSAVTSVGNGSAALLTVFDDVDTVRTTVTVQQLLAKYAIGTRFGVAQQVTFTSLGDTATAFAIPRDARNNPLQAGAAPAPTPTFSVTPVGPVSINTVSGLMTAIANSDVGTPVKVTASGGGIVSDTLPVAVQQTATSVTITGKRVDTIPSIGSTKDLIAIVRDARGNDVQGGIIWTSRNTTKVAYRTTTTGDVALAVDTGTTRMVASRDQVADSITITVTNDPETVVLTPDTLYIRSVAEIKRFSSIVVKNAKGDPLGGIPITWASSDPTIVDARADSSMRAVAVGAVDVTATTPNGKVAISRVVVTNAPQTLDIVPSSQTLASVGDTLLNIGVDFKNGLGATLPSSSASWSSQDVNVATATVDPSGNLYIIAAGTGSTYIRAISPVDPTVRDSVFITVTNAPTSIVAAPNPAPTLNAFGSTVPFTATVYNASGNPIPSAQVRWSVPSGGTFVRVDSVTGVATAMANGSATIRATSSGIFTDVPIGVVQAIAGTRSTISASNPSIVANGTSTTTITVQLRDANDNNMATGGASIVLSTSLGTLNPLPPTDNGGGQYTTTLTAGTTSGSAAITGTANGLAITNNGIVSFTPGDPAKYIVTSNNYNPPAGSSVTIRAQLADVNNNPIATSGTVVTFTSTSGGTFTPSNGQASTDVAGVATITFNTSTAASTHTVTATDGSARTGTSSPITTNAGALAKFAVEVAGGGSIGTQVVGAPFSVRMTAQDVNGNTVMGFTGAGATVDITSGNGAIFGTGGGTTPTFTNGVLTSRAITISNAGSFTITATHTGFSETGTSNGFDVRQASKYLVAAPATLASGSSALITAQLADASDNAVPTPGKTVVWTISGPGGTFATPTSLTDGSGFAQVAFTAVASGTYTITATDNTALTGTSGTLTITGGSVASFRVELEPSGNIGPQTAGVPFQIRVTALDAANNVATSFTGAGNTVNLTSTSTISSGGGTTPAFVNGVLAAHSITLTTSGINRTITATRTAGGTQSGTSQNFDVNAAALDHFLVTNTSGGTIAPQTAGVAFNVKVVAQDVFNNTVTAFNGGSNRVVFSSTSAISAGAGPSANFSNGVLASHSITLTTAGAGQTITASRDPAGPENGTSAPFDIGAAAANHLTIVTQPSATPTAGAPFSQQPVLEVRDAFENVRTSDNSSTVTASRNAGTGTLQGNTTVTVSGGIATFTNLQHNVATTITLDFNSSLGIGTVTSNNVVVSPAAADHITLVTQPSATATAGSPFAQQPVLEIRDQFENVLTGDNSSTITATRNAGSGALQGTTTQTAVAGVVTFTDLEHDVANTITIDFTSSLGLNTVTSSNIDVSPAALNGFVVEQAGGGNIGTQTSGTIFNIRVTAVDAFGNTVTSFTGSVAFTSSDVTVLVSPLTSGAFTAGVLTTESINLTTLVTKTIQLIATSGLSSGSSNSFTVNP